MFKEQNQNISNQPQGNHSTQKIKILILLILFLLALILTVIAYFLITQLTNKSKITAEQVEENSSSSEEQTITEEEAYRQVMEILEATNQPPLDNDSDDLSDEAEEAWGTDPNNPDTDGDGLSDHEETFIYFTDPLRADNDGDGYSDGDEVKNGYNPLSRPYIIEDENNEY